MTGSLPRPRLNLIALLVALATLALALPAAASAATDFPLQVEVSGEGSVSCAANAGPPESCESEYEEGAQLTLLAEPEQGSELLEWQGDCDTASGNECEVEINEAKAIEAVFGPEEFALEVQTEGTGEGVVECEVEFGPTEPCPPTEDYPYGTEVTLYAQPEQGSQFLEWGGDCSGAEAECALTVEGPLSVSADFEPGPFFALNVEEPGAGEGSVECEIEGSAEPCQAEYAEGTVVTLIAEARPGSEFIEWLGECDTASGNECEVEVSEERTVEALFDARPPVSLTINLAGTGAGEVQCKVNGSSLKACAPEYSEGAELALVATAKAGSTFTGYSAASGSAAACATSPCAFTIEANSAVTATFTPISRTLTVAKAGAGSGEVKCKFNGGSAGACASPQPNGTTVEIIATAAAGSEFTGYSAASGSAAACATSPCAFTIEANSAVTATFTLKAKEEPKKEEPKKEEPKPTPEGAAKAAATATVKSGKAELKLTCAGGPCKGTIELTAKVKQGKKAKSLVIGKAPFSLAAGATATLKVKLSGPAKSELAKGKALKAKTSGAGVSASTVKLKPAKKK